MLLKSMWRNLRHAKGFNLYIIHCALVAYTTQSFRPICAIACWSMWHLPNIIVFKNLDFVFIFFFIIATYLWTNPTREPAQQQSYCYCELLFQCTSTVSITKSYLLMYKIAFVAFELRFKIATMTAFYFSRRVYLMLYKMVTTRLLEAELLW